jgi:hypothetical protein
MKDKYNCEDDDPPLPRSPDVDIKSIGLKTTYSSVKLFDKWKL